MNKVAFMRWFPAGIYSPWDRRWKVIQAGVKREKWIAAASPNLKRFAVNKIKNRSRGMLFNRMNLVGWIEYFQIILRPEITAHGNWISLTFDHSARTRFFVVTPPPPPPFACSSDFVSFRDTRHTWQKTTEKQENAFYSRFISSVRAWLAHFSSRFEPFLQNLLHFARRFPHLLPVMVKIINVGWTTHGDMNFAKKKKKKKNVQPLCSRSTPGKLFETARFWIRRDLI